ncbi:PAS domain-containing protein [Belliella sp. R4-6]|uniref:histidine kinase n=1 Tax=Belliella alkalica TaxID=1730871 RepID=A0ABS9VFF0_9BACT|nr:PAS domain-containing protein [Belliella alkalica]MCH7415167.1 PAS domain-containing protein [Belliella alkalica]
METIAKLVEKDIYSMMESKYYYLVELDKNGKVNNTNIRLKNIFTSVETPLIGQSFGEILFPNDFLNFQNSHRIAMEENSTNFQIDLRKVNEDNSDFHWTRWEFTITRKENSDFTIMGIGHDILKINEKIIEFPEFIYEHQIKNEIMEGLFEDNLIGFWLWDIENENDQLSVSLRTMLGYDNTSKDKKEVKWKKHIHIQDKEKVNQHLEEHFSSFGETPFHSELRILSLSGKEIWSIAYGKVVKWDEDGKPLNMIGCFFDISEKKKSEIILDKQNKFLRELTFNQSHMMRSKLANIMGILEVIQPRQNQEELDQLLSLLKEEAYKLDKALQDSIHSSSALNSSKTN